MNKNELYMDKINAQIEQESAKIALMRAKAAEVNANSKLEYLEQLEKLEGKLDGLKDKYGQLKDSSDSTWESIKEGTESAWEDLKDAVAKVAKRF